MPGPQLTTDETVKVIDAVSTGSIPVTQSDLQNAVGDITPGHRDAHFIQVDQEREAAQKEHAESTEEEKKKAALAEVTALGGTINIKSLSPDDFMRMQSAAQTLQGMDLSPEQRAQLADIEKAIEEKKAEDAAKIQNAVFGGVGLFAALRMGSGGSSGDGSANTNASSHGKVDDVEAMRRMEHEGAKGLAAVTHLEDEHHQEEKHERTVQNGSGAPVVEIDGRVPATAVATEAVVGNEVAPQEKSAHASKRELVEAAKTAIFQDPSIGHGFVEPGKMQKTAEEWAQGRTGTETKTSDIQNLVNDIKSGKSGVTDEIIKQAHVEINDEPAPQAHPFASFLADFKPAASIGAALHADFNSVSVPGSLPAVAMNKSAPELPSFPK